MVEFALVLPMFLVVTTGIFSFGVALNNYLQLTNGVTMASQTVADSRGSTAITDPCAAAVSTIKNTAPYLTQSSVKYSFTFTSPTGTTTGSSPYTGTGSATCSGANSSTVMQQYGSVTLLAQYPCTLAGYGFSFGCNLSAQVTEMIQ